MTQPMHLPPPSTLLRAAACVALLVLALGLPRLLVLCEHGDGDAELAFRHAPDACCHDHESVGAPGESGSEDGPGLHDGRRCTHSDLLIELLPAPRPDRAEPPPAPATLLPATALAPAPTLLRAVPRPPPPTGPPRVDRRTALRATTLLLV